MEDIADEELAIHICDWLGLGRGEEAGSGRDAGTLVAKQSCPAYQSIRNQTNPGGVTIEPGRSYPITGKNKAEATYYQIMVDGASPAQRWVEVACGDVNGAAATPSGAATAVPPSGAAPAGVARATHVLALSWEPAFCLEHADKTECARETGQSSAATHLSLHGLWPQPRGKAYCGDVGQKFAAADRSHDWNSLPEPDLSDATKKRLSAVMPGTQSGLERHEWIEHGTCFGATANSYFNRAAELVEQVNASGVRDLFAENVGKSLASDAIQAAFDKSFGAGAGARVTVSCQGHGSQRTIGELVISLAGDVAGSAPIGDLILTAAPSQPGCPAGLVAQPAD